MTDRSAADGGASVAVKRRAAWRGYGLRTIAVATLVVGLLLAVAVPTLVTIARGGLATPYVTIIGIIVAAPFIYLSLHFLRRSRRHLVPSAVTVLAEDPRPPVVYLRAFSSDARTAKVDTDTTTLATFLDFDLTLLSFVREWRGKSEEEYWSSATSPIGPAIAIGAPGQLPFRGAARLYVSGDEWQQRVLQLIQQAGLVVVLGGGGGEGLRWEIEQVSRSVRPEQLVFLLPNNANDYESLRSVLNEIRHVDIGERPRVTHRMTVCALLRFETDGTPEVRPVWGASRTDVMTALKPVLDELDQTPSAGRTPSRGRPAP